MQRIFRRGVAIVAAVALFAGAAGVADAAHEANNAFRLQPPAMAELPNASGFGFSNYIISQGLWTSRVEVTGLRPGTAYTFWAEGAAGDIAVCSFVTDGAGAGGCNRGAHPEPALATARIRTGAAAPDARTVRGDVVLESPSIQRTPATIFAVGPSATAP